MIIKGECAVMNPKILSIVVEGVKTYKNNVFNLDFMTEQRVFQHEKDDKVVTSVSKHGNLNNIIALAGVNASGKTSSLLLINYVLHLVFLGSNANFKKQIIDLFDEKIKIHTTFICDNFVYKTTSELEKKKYDDSIRIEFCNEIICRKKINKNTSKKDLKFNNEQEEPNLEIVERKKLDGTILKFLKNEDSIIPSQLSNLPKNYVIDTFSQTDMNFLSGGTGFPSEMIMYLDQTIEEISLQLPKDLKKEDLTIDKLMFNLKFENEPRKTVSIVDLNMYLSSGTIKGLGLLNRIIRALKVGGYLLVDELEIHFNKSIVENIIDLFQSDVNEKGATIIFSTHYSELLDSLTRRDSIRVVRKIENKIEIESLNNLANKEDKNRSDIKNSDLFLSGLFGTAPSFDRYWKLNRFIKGLIEG